MSKIISFATGCVLVATGMWYYDGKNSMRYPVEEEYAFISTCIGQNSRKQNKKLCIDFLKRCHQAEQKDIKACIDYIKKN
ncbi:hypothetical protein HEE88_001635 [Campylobacter upsaliensis]|uniref:Uncharacterized protein n=1 Tax=Campylobacter upsaliensis TaxID=28080 RepID=A0A5L4PLU9_CAMUP|nr:hypothetical protein [Campylobacter upsaliensis]EAH5199826.1 hypothetical protein [Campylobacter upsaliensis]EAI2894291.1 hypothetical protein [Campylobacter upsaliensis]EAI4456875.1 hypothetical protein [Campylobacter upsaliensis]EAI6143711.1 hypothetical protein [Campylobacter upsaliensis]